MKALISALGLSILLVSGSAFANGGSLGSDATYVAITAPYKASGIKVGDEIQFNSTYTSLTINGEKVDDCQVAPQDIADQADALKVVACGDGEDFDFYIFKNDGKTVELLNVATFELRNSAKSP